MASTRRQRGEAPAPAVGPGSVARQPPWGRPSGERPPASACREQPRGHRSQPAPGNTRLPVLGQSGRGDTRLQQAQPIRTGRYEAASSSANQDARPGAPTAYRSRGTPGVCRGLSQSGVAEVKPSQWLSPSGGPANRSPSAEAGASRRPGGRRGEVSVGTSHLDPAGGRCHLGTSAQGRGGCLHPRRHPQPRRGHWLRVTLLQPGLGQGTLGVPFTSRGLQPPARGALQPAGWARWPEELRTRDFLAAVEADFVISRPITPTGSSRWWPSLFVDT